MGVQTTTETSKVVVVQQRWLPCTFASCKKVTPYTQRMASLLQSSACEDVIHGGIKSGMSLLAMRVYLPAAPSDPVELGLPASFLLSSQAAQ